MTSDVREEQNRIAIVAIILATIFVLHPIVYCDVEKDNCQRNEVLLFLLALTEFASIGYGFYIFFLAISYVPNNSNFFQFRELAHKAYAAGSILAVYFMAIVALPLIGFPLSISFPGWLYNIVTIILLLLLTYELFLRKKETAINQKWVKK